MDRNWQRPFGELQDQFRQAAQQPRQLRLIVGKFPGPASFDTLFRQLLAEDRQISQREGSHVIRGVLEWKFQSSTHKEIGVISGQSDAAELFCKLGTAAGSYMPIELRPKLPFLTDERLASVKIPIPSERYPVDEFGSLIDDGRSEPLCVWIEYLFQRLFGGGQAGAFTFQIQWNRNAEKADWPANRPRETLCVKLGEAQRSLVSTWPRLSRNSQ